MSRHTRRRSVLRRALLTMLATTAVAGGSAPVAAAAEPASTNGTHGFATEAAQAPTLTDAEGSFRGGAEPQLAAGLVLLVSGVAGGCAGIAAGRPRRRSRTAQVATAEPV